MSSRLRPIRSLGLLVTLPVALLCSACEEDPQPEEREATWENVQDVFVDSGCATESCHGEAGQAELTLVGDPEEVYDALVGAPCTNPKADDDGMLRVAAGDVDGSFLWTKLTLAAYDSDLGAPMPITGEALSAEDLELVRRWIERGAPLSE